MQFYFIITIIIVLAAIFSYVNYCFFHLPSTIGLMIMALIGSIILVTIGISWPASTQYITNLIGSVDFPALLLKVMLGFLLFAGAIHSDAGGLKKQAGYIIVLATVGVLLSTIIVGSLTYYTFHLFGAHVPFIYCLLFGILISPTDPIAVLGILKRSAIPDLVS